MPRTPILNADSPLSCDVLRVSQFALTPWRFLALPPRTFFAGMERCCPTPTQFSLVHTDSAPVAPRRPSWASSCPPDDRTVAYIQNRLAAARVH